MQIFDVFIFFQLHTKQQKTVKPTYLCPLGARKLAEGKGHETASWPLVMFWRVQSVLSYVVMVRRVHSVLSYVVIFWRVQSVLSYVVIFWRVQSVLSYVVMFRRVESVLSHVCVLPFVQFVWAQSDLPHVYVQLSCFDDFSQFCSLLVPSSLFGWERAVYFVLFCV